MKIVNEDSKRTSLAFFSLFLTGLEFINLPSTGFWRPFRKLNSTTETDKKFENAGNLLKGNKR